MATLSHNAPFHFQSKVPLFLFNSPLSLTHTHPFLPIFLCLPVCVCAWVWMHVCACACVRVYVCVCVRGCASVTLFSSGLSRSFWCDFWDSLQRQKQSDPFLAPEFVSSLKKGRLWFFCRVIIGGEKVAARKAALMFSREKNCEWKQEEELGKKL